MSARVISIYIRLVILALMVVASNTNASTICSINCPDTGGGAGGGLPQLVEIFSTDGSNLLLSTNGLIILDENLFATLSNLKIHSQTPVYMGLSELPSSSTLPELLQLITISFTGDASFIGLENDILLRQFDDSAMLDLSASNGILVMDTASLFSVPLPAAVWLFISGLFSLFYFGLKKQ